MGRRRFGAAVKLVVVTIAFGTLAVGQTAGTGAVSGYVADEKGKAIANAVVTLSILPVGKAVQPFLATTRTGQDGSFTGAGLPPGSYQVCAQVEGSTLVDVCRWGMPATTAAVQAGSTTTIQAITLKKGHKVHVRVLDAQNLLQANEGVTRGAHLLIGVWTSKGLFVQAPITNKDAGGRDHELYVPEDTDLQLSVFSAFFGMSDAQGAPLAKNPMGASSGGVRFRAGAADGPKEFVFQVTGKN